jgi:hypothetical protein
VQETRLDLHPARAIGLHQNRYCAFPYSLGSWLDHTRNQFDIKNIPENLTISRDNFLIKHPKPPATNCFYRNPASAGFFMCFLRCPSLIMPMDRFTKK